MLAGKELYSGSDYQIFSVVFQSLRRLFLRKLKQTPEQAESNVELAARAYIDAVLLAVKTHHTSQRIRKRQGHVTKWTPPKNHGRMFFAVYILRFFFPNFRSSFIHPDGKLVASPKVRGINLVMEALSISERRTTRRYLKWALGFESRGSGGDCKWTYTVCGFDKAIRKGIHIETLQY